VPPQPDTYLHQGTTPGERDNQIDLEFLKRRTKERLVFPEIIYKGSVLHPITFVYSRNGAAKLILTKDFIADPLNAINC